jgi:hypothetical protein
VKKTAILGLSLSILSFLIVSITNKAQSVDTEIIEQNAFYLLPEEDREAPIIDRTPLELAIQEKEFSINLLELMIKKEIMAQRIR